MPVASSDIPTLKTLYQSSKLSPPSSPSASPSSAHNARIALVRTDITTLNVDAIVNAANGSLLGGGGVDGAIHRAAGSELLHECAELDGCDTGSAKMTKGYKLPAKYVIHAVGPVYHKSKAEESARLLKGCYETSLRLATENGCKSLAFSAISTGIYGYPSQDAAAVAIDTVRRFLDHESPNGPKLERIVFCSFLEKDEQAYEKLISKYFPPAD